MDVDVIFRRGYAYTLATLCVLAGFYAIVFSLGSMVQKNFKDDPGNIGLITVMLIATFLFQPHPQLDTGTAGPLLLSRPLRLPPHADRIRARAEFGNRSRPHAAIGGRPADADALDPARGFFPRRPRRRSDADGGIADGGCA